MKPQKQLIKHDPEKSDWGDCTRTCYAALFNLDAKDVPHFCDRSGEDHIVRINRWLEERDCRLANFAFNHDPMETMKMMANMNPSLYYIMGCASAIANHSVLCLGDRVVCDPGLSVEAIEHDGSELKRCSDGYTWIDIVVPLSLCAPAHVVSGLALAI